MAKIMHSVTISKSLILMDGQIDYLTSKGHEMHIVSSPGKEIEEYKGKVHISKIYMAREINLLKDIFSLLKCIKVIYISKPDIINYGTPKAALLNAIASFINRVPVRVYKVQGLRYETAKGLKRILLKNIERLIILLSTDVLSISQSTKNKMIDDNLLRKKTVTVLNNGSSNGLKEKYRNSKISKEKLQKIKEHVGITDEFVVGFVGRLNKDKGLQEIISIIKSIDFSEKNIKFIIIGSIEETNLYSELKSLEDKYNNRVKILGRKENLEYYYRLMDVLLFPTHREGFGNVSIEAQSQWTPVITTNATGVVDTVIDKQTGFICSVGDYEEMLNKIIMLYSNKALQLKMSENSREYVINNFNQQDLWESLEQYYQELLLNIKFEN